MYLSCRATWFLCYLSVIHVGCLLLSRCSTWILGLCSNIHVAWSFQVCSTTWICIILSKFHVVVPLYAHFIFLKSKPWSVICDLCFMLQVIFNVLPINDALLLIWAFTVNCSTYSRIDVQAVQQYPQQIHVMAIWRLQIINLLVYFNCFAL